MNAQEAKQLKPGTKVFWGDNKKDTGTVSDVCIDVAFQVVWENGQSGWIDNRDAKDVNLL